MMNLFTNMNSIGIIEGIGVLVLVLSVVIIRLLGVIRIEKRLIKR